MKTIIIGEHYAFDNGNPLEKLIMYVTSKGKYEGEDVVFFDTISLNSWSEVFEKDFDVDFFNNEYIRVATSKEIQKLRKQCPIDSKWMEETMDKIISKYWNINTRPEIIFDKDEPLEKPYYGVYDSNIKAILFRSEFLILLSKERIEKILTHELCHWYLHITGQHYKDKDVRFAKEIIRLGIEDTINYHNDQAREAYEEAKLS